MFKKKIYLLITAVVISLFIGVGSAKAACQVDGTVVVNGVNNWVLKNARFAIFEQLTDASGKTIAGKLLGAATTDKSTGLGQISVPLTEGVSNYVVKVSNPTFDGFDFWYFNKLTLTCGQKFGFTAHLGAVELKVSDYQGLLQKNTKYTVYAQKTDFNGEPVIGKQIGVGDTGDVGIQDIYLPIPAQAPSLDGDSYTLEIKNTKGLKFYKYNLVPPDGDTLRINYRFSDIVVKAKDAQTGALLPGIKLNMFERLPGDTGGFKAGRMLGNIQTDQNGVGYLQYPAGQYMFQYTKTNGEKVNFYDALVKTEERTEFDLNLEGYAPARCDIKSSLVLAFRDFDEKIVGNLNFSIYEQKLDNNGSPVVGNKVSNGRVDSAGLSKIDFYPQPAVLYLIQVCDKSPTFGCLWFKNVSFDCNQDLKLARTLKSIDVILRDAKLKLLPGQKFKIYVKQKDADGRTIIDKTKLVGSFTVPTNGDFRFYLDNQELDGSPIEYLLAIDWGRQEIFTEFKVSDDTKTVLEYIVGNPLKAYLRPFNYSKLLGRIVLQTNGDAWYINPANRKRYFLGQGDNALRIMKRLSVGIGAADLAKIRPNIDFLSADAVDTDGDGLPDAAEKSLGAFYDNPDSDGDGYGDYTEIKNGYNPRGAGKLNINDKIASKNLGKILYQIKGLGDAWYINPVNHQRYYFGPATDVNAALKALGIGISNADLSRIPAGPAM